MRPSNNVPERSERQTFEEKQGVVPPPRIVAPLLHSPKVIVGKTRQKQIRKTYKQKKKDLETEPCRPLLKPHMYSLLKKELEYYKLTNARLKSHCIRLEGQLTQHQTSAAIFAQELHHPSRPSSSPQRSRPVVAHSGSGADANFFNRYFSAGPSAEAALTLSEREELHMLRVRCNDLLQETEQLKSILRSFGFTSNKIKKIGTVTHASVGVQATARHRSSDQEASPNQQELHHTDGPVPLNGYAHALEQEINQNMPQEHLRVATENGGYGPENTPGDIQLEATGVKHPSKPKGFSSSPSPINSQRQHVKKIWKRQPSVEDCIASYRLPKTHSGDHPPVLHPKDERWRLLMTGNSSPASKLRSKYSKSGPLWMYSASQRGTLQRQHTADSKGLSSNNFSNESRQDNAPLHEVGDLVQVWGAGLGEWKVARIKEVLENNRYDVDFGGYKQSAVPANDIRVHEISSEEEEAFRATL